MNMPHGVDKALSLIRNLPRVSLDNLVRYPGFKKRVRKRGPYGGGTHGFPKSGSYAHQNPPRLGYEGGQIPFTIRIPREPYYRGHHIRRQYPPISMHQLQTLIDTGRLDITQPIDLTSICNTKIFYIFPEKNHFGFQLTDESIDKFASKINIEVQWTTETVIAAIESNGGTITTAYYDIRSLLAAVNPLMHFERGNPIPKRLLPPQDAISYYTDPKTRGYLANPEKIAEERVLLAQKYGYKLPDLNSDPDKEMLLLRKDPNQVFYGLEPGWVVNLKDKTVLCVEDDELQDYYHHNQPSVT